MTLNKYSTETKEEGYFLISNICKRCYFVVAKREGKKGVSSFTFMVIRKKTRITEVTSN